MDDIITMKLEEIQDEKIKLGEKCEVLASTRDQLEAERDTIEKRLIDIDAELRKTNRLIKNMSYLWKQYAKLEAERTLEKEGLDISEGITGINTWTPWDI